MICLNNGGGGIFDFLPVASQADPEDYERHIATPAGLDLERVAAMAGMRFTRDDLEAGAASPGLVELRTDRASNVAEHRALTDRVGVLLTRDREPGS